MRLKIWDRIALGVGAIYLALSGAAIFLMGVLIDGIPLQGLTQEPALLNRWVLVVCGLLLLAFGIYLLSLPRRNKRGKTDFIVQQTATGELRISVKAIESLVQKCVTQHNDMTLQGMTVQSRRDGVIIELKMAVPGNISIPLAVAALQKQVREYLLTSSGVDVKEVRVSVETADNLARESLYLVKNPAAANENAAGAEPSKEAEESDRMRGKDHESL